MNAIDAAAEARHWRQAAREPHLTPDVIVDRLERAERFQSQAVLGIHGRSDRTEECA